MIKSRFKLLAAGLAAALTVLIGGPTFAAEPSAGDYALNDYLVAQPRFTLPFYLFNGHILIDGAVDGRRGKFMFDTGTEFALFLNNHYLPLAKEQFVGKGHAGSGQEMVLYRQSSPITSIEIGDQIRFDGRTAVMHTDWSFLEQAYTPLFLGSLGHGFNRNYLFVIDYGRQTIAFHGLNQPAQALAEVIDSNRIVATIHFTPVGVDGKMPEVQLQLGDETIAAFFDTGSMGTLELTETSKAALERSGDLIVRAEAFNHGTRQAHLRASVKNLRHGNITLHDATHLSFSVGTKNRLGLGYHFLKHYVSAWDYRQRTLTLLKP